MAGVFGDGGAVCVRALATRLMPGGRLLLCATPIGNLEDVTLRLLRVLGEAEVVACEDTRRTRKLLTHHGVHAARLMTYNEGNERRKAPELVEMIRRGSTVALVSDAGMPGLSDPGFHLVRACTKAGLPVEVIPGPTAAISALALSGLPPARFVFEGFLPRKKGERIRRLQQLEEEERTVVIYESPHRIQDALSDLAATWGPRPAVLARELTKMHEEIRRGDLGELAEGVKSDPPRGEIVLVIGGCLQRDREVDPSELAQRARTLMAQGMERRDAMQEVARATGVPRRAVFDALIEDREG